MFYIKVTQIHSRFKKCEISSKAHRALGKASSKCLSSCYILKKSHNTQNTEKMFWNNKMMMMMAHFITFSVTLLSSATLLGWHFCLLFLLFFRCRCICRWSSPLFGTWHNLVVFIIRIHVIHT